MSNITDALRLLKDSAIRDNKFRLGLLGRQDIDQVISLLEEEASRESQSAVPSDNRIVVEALKVARMKDDKEDNLLPNEDDMRMFCAGARWMREELTKRGIAG